MGGQAGQVLCSAPLLYCPLTQETDCEADPALRTNTASLDPTSLDPAVRRDPASLVLQNRLAQVSQLARSSKCSNKSMQR